MKDDMLLIRPPADEKSEPKDAAKPDENKA